jgi:hypothetical protein
MFSSPTKPIPRVKASFERADPARVLKAIEDIVAGEDLTRIAESMDLPQDQLSKRVERALLVLDSQVGLPGVRRRNRRSTFVLRHHGLSVLEAIERYRKSWQSFEPDKANDRLFYDAYQAMFWLRTEKDLNRAAAYLRTALLYAAWYSGLSGMELARLRIKDYFNEDGGVRLEGQTRSWKKGRRVTWAEPVVRDVMDAYLTQRLDKDTENLRGKRYRGFDQHARLFNLDLVKEGKIESDQLAAKRITNFLNSVAKHAGFVQKNFSTAARTRIAQKEAQEEANRERHAYAFLRDAVSWRLQSAKKPLPDETRDEHLRKVLHDLPSLQRVMLRAVWLLGKGFYTAETRALFARVLEVSEIDQADVNNALRRLLELDLIGQVSLGRYNIRSARLREILEARALELADVVASRSP